MLNGGQKTEQYWFRFASDKPQRTEQPTHILLSPSQLPNTWSWGFLCHRCSMCPEASRSRINTTVGYGTNVMLRTRGKSFWGKNMCMSIHMGGSRESSEYFVIVPVTGQRELGWLGPDVKTPQKRQPSSTEAAIFYALMPTALTFKQRISRPKDVITHLYSAL